MRSGGCLVSNVESGRVSLKACLAGAKSYASSGILNIRLLNPREPLRVFLALHVTSTDSAHAEFYYRHSCGEVGQF